MKSLTPPKYASPQTSGLTVEVKPGMEPVELNSFPSRKADPIQ